RLAMYQGNGILNQRVLRYLKRLKHRVNNVNKVTSHTIQNYDVVIFTEDLQINNIIKVLEQIVLEEAILVIFIHNEKLIHHFYNIQNHPYFMEINEKHLKTEWELKIPIALKYIKELTRLNAQLKQTKVQLSTMKSEQKAKRILMNKGFSEAESHHYIQQKAMALRKSKNVIVNLIIENKIDFSK
ncbi:MAG: hypothetical protein K9L26_01960, partial [Candidatus Izimaplasma sp.]|nr:hypothetical protein [Candidatus Izimaplasma bacterium]